MLMGTSRFVFPFAVAALAFTPYVQAQPKSNRAFLGTLARPASAKVEIDLFKPFHTRSPWRFVATQDPAVFQPVDPALIGSIPKGFTGSWAPGVMHLCLRVSPTASCAPDLVAMPQPPAPLTYSDWEPHYLNQAQLVFPRRRTAPPLLLLQTAGMHSGDGDQAVYTQLLAYSRARDRFGQVYAHVTGRNNNEEVRFIKSGPLRGDVISVEPAINRPYGYWITVDTLTPATTYKQVLRYRSATLYNDGNKLAVIDSEMPNIERRLGLWRPGSPMPLPTSLAHPCKSPRLSHRELWCQ
jgi:hypothetical protein